MGGRGWGGAGCSSPGSPLVLQDTGCPVPLRSSGSGPVTGEPPSRRQDPTSLNLLTVGSRTRAAQALPGWLRWGASGRLQQWPCWCPRAPGEGVRPGPRLACPAPVCLPRQVITEDVWPHSTRYYPREDGSRRRGNGEEQVSLGSPGPRAPRRGKEGPQEAGPALSQQKGRLRLRGAWAWGGLSGHPGSGWGAGARAGGPPVSRDSDHRRFQGQGLSPSQAWLLEPCCPSE